jgi:hypothetical protein
MATNQEELSAEELAEQKKLEDEKAALKKAAEDEDREAEELLKAKPRKTNDDDDMIARLVSERVNQELSGIKGKLDNAFKQRDEALSKIAEFEKKERESTLKRLEEEGKHKEVYELKLAEERAKNEALEKINTELSRDVSVRDALKSYTFRNDKAADMAFREIVSSLVRDESGKWVHRSGISVRDFVEAFSKDEDQSFLFKPKTSTGGGSSSPKSGSGDSKPKSIFEMSQAEVLKLAAEGKLKK